MQKIKIKCMIKDEFKTQLISCIQENFKGVYEYPMEPESDGLLTSLPKSMVIPFLSNPIYIGVVNESYVTILLCEDKLDNGYCNVPFTYIPREWVKILYKENA